MRPGPEMPRDPAPIPRETEPWCAKRPGPDPVPVGEDAIVGGFAPQRRNGRRANRNVSPTARKGCRPSPTRPPVDLPPRGTFPGRPDSQASHRQVEEESERSRRLRPGAREKPGSSFSFEWLGP